MGRPNTEVKKVQSYVYIRIWLTLLVFLGHSSSLAITSMDLTVNIDPYVESGVYVKMFTTFIMNVIYSFHMPAFMMLSGSLFALTFCHSKKVRWCKKRVSRLLVPFLGVAFFFLLPIRILVGYYGQSIDYFNIIINDILLAKDVSYLWYLLALFEISMVMGVFSRIVLTNNSKIQIALFLFLGGVSAIQFILPEYPFVINDFLRFLFWFYVGILFEKYHAVLKQWMNQYTLMFLGGIWLLTFIVHTIMQQQILSGAVLENILVYKAIKMGIRYCVELSGSLVLFGFALKIRTGALNKLTAYMEKNSFAIYLYHAPIMMLTKKVVHLIISPQQMTEILYAVSLFCVMIVSFFGSLGMHFLVNRAQEMIKRNWIKSSFAKR